MHHLNEKNKRHLKRSDNELTQMEGIARIFISIGLVLLLAGFMLFVLSRLGVSSLRLPGDILVRRENFSFYFPITTMLLISLVLTLLFNLLGRR